MHIGNRIFPYPVLNRNEALSDYVEDSVFKVEFDVDESGAPIVQNGEVVFKNLHYTITDIYSQYGSLEEILDAHSWFNAVCISYKRKTGNALTFEEFENMSKLELAQMVLNSASCKDHWLLTQGKRRGLFFGVLSRCYFRVTLSIDETLDDPYELAKFVIENPLRFRELTWRSFSSEKMIVIGTLKAEMRVMGEYPQAEENTKHFAEIAKSLSKLGSVMLLDCMTEKDIEEYVYKKYKRMIEEDLANRGLFDKLKDAVIKVFK